MYHYNQVTFLKAAAGPSGKGVGFLIRLVVWVQALHPAIKRIYS